MFINENYQTSSSLNIHSGTAKQNSKTWTCSDYIYFKQTLRVERSDLYRILPEFNVHFSLQTISQACFR